VTIENVGDTFPQEAVIFDQQNPDLCELRCQTASIPLRIQWLFWHAL